MEIRGLGDNSLIYIPSGHKWFESPENIVKHEGTLIFDCVDCDSVLALSFKQTKGLKKGHWMSSVQRADNCCDEAR
jgi:hypothetical protein